MHLNNWYGWTMLQKLLANDFNWFEETSEFDESFIKSFNEESDEGCCVEVGIKYLENLHKRFNDLPFFT